MLRESLAGRTVAVTGATGFLGTALVERLLRSVPDCGVALLVRPGRRGRPTGCAERSCATTASTACEASSATSSTPRWTAGIKVIAGDVGVDGLGLDAGGRDVLAACHTVIHSAATVSFDSPLDAAVEINLLGPTRVASTLLELHRTALGPSPI